MIRPQYHFRPIGSDIHIWDVLKLAESAESLPIFDHPLTDIREIDEPYWFAATGDVPTCRAVMAHAAQTHGTDLTYPVLLCPEGRIVDGMHRVMKALGQGQTHIKARRLTHLPPPDFRNLRPADLPYEN